MTANEQFRQVLRGYEPSEVDRRIEELVRSDEGARARVEELTARLRQLEAAHVEALSAAEEARAVSSPSYDDLGSRIAQMLSLADEEANELRTSAKDDADALHASAHQESEQVKSDADKYAQQRHSSADTEAAEMLKQARRQADELLDGADRDAAARRQEAEAVYETQRAKAAAAAADFEMTLAQRRETAENEFTQQLASSHEQLAAMEARVEQVRNDAEKLHADAEVQARRLIEDADQRAAETIAQSRAHADRIRAESERELSAATQRRDSINAQLSNVRQMLATLSGAAPSGLLFSVAGDEDDESGVDGGEGSQTDSSAVPEAAIDESAEGQDVDVVEAAESANGADGEPTDESAAEDGSGDEGHPQR